MNFTRAEIAAAIAYWGVHGTGGEKGLSLPRQASKLVDVLAVMDFERESVVALSEDSERGKLACEALGRSATRLDASSPPTP